MLVKVEPDTEIVRAWLARALGEPSKAKGKRAELAQRCGVRPQAVSGWLKTGRITKKNLEVASDYFGYGPSFTPGVHVVRDRRTIGYAGQPWPFRFIDYDLVSQLKADEKLLLEGAWLKSAKDLGFVLSKPAVA